MGGDGSAFATLGLEPGADRATVERAYRALIKHHHPDRAGGDPARAAEINRAYRELREERFAHGGIEWHDAGPGRSRRFLNSWLAVALLLALASLALLAAARRDAPLGGAGTRPLADKAGLAEAPIAQPVEAENVAAGVREAMRIARSGDEMALTSASRACHERFRAAPSIALLDRCAAFDDAVVLLQDRDPMRNRGAFGELAVTGRQWAAAKALSDDYMAIDGRLGEVRVKVELLLAGSGAATL